MEQQRVVLLRSNPVNPDPPVEKMAETLLGQGYQVTILAWDRSEKYESREDRIVFSNEKTASIVRFGIPALYGGGLKKNFKSLLSFEIRLKKWLKKNRNTFDIIHAFDFDTGFIAKKIAKKYHKKLVYHILDFYVHSHSLGKGWLYNTVKKKEISVINFSDATIICTEKRKEQIKGSDPKKLVVIHNTPKCFLEESEKELRDNIEKIKIVYVGIFGQGRLLPELLQVVKENPRVELHIGGFGELEEMVSNFAKTSENIFYYGKMPYKEVLELEKKCDVMTAIYDPTILNHQYAAPNKFYEAIMLGKPIIMVKNTGWDKVVEDNQIGCLIDYSKEGLHLGLERVANLVNDVNIETRSKKLYQNEYSWDLMEERIKRLYSDLRDK